MTHAIQTDKTVKELIDAHRAKVVLVGTSHIAKQSEQIISDAINKHKPSIGVVLEQQRND